MPEQLASPQRRAEILAAYPHHTNAELAARFGLPERTLVYIASKAKVRKSDDTLRRTHRISPPASQQQRQALRDAIHAAGPAGVSWTDAERLLPAAQPRQLSKFFAGLVADGAAHRAGPHHYTRWFATALHAQAYAAQPKPLTKRQRRCIEKPAAAQEAATAAPPLRIKKASRAAAQEAATAAPPLRIKKASRAATPGVVAPTRGPALQPGAPIITERTRLTQCRGMPSHEARWHVNAKPVFSADRPGQYLDAEPRSWVAAITGSKQP